MITSTVFACGCGGKLSVSWVFDATVRRVRSRLVGATVVGVEVVPSILSLVGGGFSAQTPVTTRHEVTPTPGPEPVPLMPLPTQTHSSRVHLVVVNLCGGDGVGAGAWGDDDQLLQEFLFATTGLRWMIG